MGKFVCGLEERDPGYDKEVCGARELVCDRWKNVEYVG